MANATNTARRARADENGGDETPPASTALVIIDRIDDELIVAELQGRAVEQWAYSFPQDGKSVEGLTVVGAAAASREMAKMGEALRVIDYNVERTDEDVVAFVTIGRYAIKDDGTEILLDTHLGTRRESWKKFGRNKGWYHDDTALEKAVSKAERNARLKSIDERVKQQVLRAALAGGNGRVARPTESEQRSAANGAAKQAGPKPPAADVAIADARRGMFAAAQKTNLKSGAAVHMALGLECGNRSHQDVDKGKDNYCSAITEWIASIPKPDADCYRFLTQCLSNEWAVTDGITKVTDAEGRPFIEPEIPTDNGGNESLTGEVEQEPLPEPPA